MTAGASNPGPSTVVYVDDEADIGTIVSLVLNADERLRCHVFVSGDEALRAMQTLRPDLVLLDVMMPQASGHDVLRRMRALPALRAGPVACVTALDPRADGRSLQGDGVVGVLHKPFSPSGLRHDVLRLCGWPAAATAAASEPVAPLPVEPLRAGRASFAARAATDLARMSALAARGGRGDRRAAQQLRITAHSLGGLAGLLGVPSVRSPCLTIERVVARWLDATGAAPELEPTWPTTATALQAIARALADPATG